MTQCPIFSYLLYFCLHWYTRTAVIVTVCIYQCGNKQMKRKQINTFPQTLFGYLFTYTDVISISCKKFTQSQSIICSQADVHKQKADKLRQYFGLRSRFVIVIMWTDAVLHQKYLSFILSIDRLRKQWCAWCCYWA